MMRYIHLARVLTSGLTVVFCVCMTESAFAGSIVGWGSNSAGQATPPDGNDFVAIAAGAGNSLALKSDGSIVGWGYNIDGQATPPEGNDFAAIDAGGLSAQPMVPSGYSLALKSDGSIISWGSMHRPYGFDGNDFKAIAAGDGFCLALKSDGSISGWGSNSYGQATPPDGNDFVAISAGYYHNLALKSDGSIIGWGLNTSSQATPPAGNDFVAIAAGEGHSLAIRKSCEFELAGDLNDDCKVDFTDFEILAANWLIDCNLDPSNPACVPK